MNIEEKIIRNISEVYNVQIEKINVIYRTILHSHYVLRTKTGQYFLKTYSYNEENIKLLNILKNLYEFLKESELNIPSIIPTYNDCMYHIKDNIIYVMFDYIEHDQLKVTDKNIQYINTEISRLHSVLKEKFVAEMPKVTYKESVYNIKNTFQLFIDNYDVNTLKSSGGNIYNAMKERMELFDFLENNITKDYDFQIIHGDLNIKNILSSNNKIWFIDFDSFRLDTPIRDIACFLVSIYPDMQTDLTIYEKIIQEFSNKTDFSKKEIYCFMIFELLNSLSLFLQKIKIYARLKQSNVIIENFLDCLEYLLKKKEVLL